MVGLLWVGVWHDVSVLLRMAEYNWLGGSCLLFATLFMVMYCTRGLVCGGGE